MATERENIPERIARLPENAYEQILNMPSIAELEKINKELFDKVRGILDYHGVVYYPEECSYRVKSSERIWIKMAERRSNTPIMDVVGARFVVRSTDRFRLASMIPKVFPLTPDTLYGRPTVRDYANPTVLDYIRKNFNPNMSPIHSALHINVIFPTDFKFDQPAEIQFLSPEEFHTYRQTREGYVNGRKAS